jgi:hypothetical protein
MASIRNLLLTGGDTRGRDSISKRVASPGPPAETARDLIFEKATGLPYFFNFSQQGRRGAKNLDNAPCKISHGNSLDYVGGTYVYWVKGPDGSTYKMGESM